MNFQILDVVVSLGVSIGVAIFAGVVWGFSQETQATLSFITLFGSLIYFKLIDLKGEQND